MLHFLCLHLDSENGYFQPITLFILAEPYQTAGTDFAETVLLFAQSIMMITKEQGDSQVIID